MDNMEIIGLGALNIDNIYRVERILEDGESLIKEAGSFSGGSAANTIYGLSRLGIVTGFIGAVGNDNKGKSLIRDFNKLGVETRYIIVKAKESTGKTLCLSDFSGKRSIYVLPGANNQLSIDDINLSYINSARYLHISSFTGDRQFELILELMDKIAPSVKVSFSPGSLYASKGIKALAPILSRIHILFINHDEIQTLIGRDVVSSSAICLEYGCQIIAVTLGKGVSLTSSTPSAICYIKDSNNEYSIKPVDVEEFCVDTTGAGDAFATGFLYGLINNKGLDECGKLGNIVALSSITRMGARQGLPTITQLSKFYEEIYNGLL
ncbi:MAG: carbohydrate kinase family protein [Dehalococcoidia bacterium]|nr:MAG: carbohydrate kinase family protein [Dehalococcoidia bacterium]